MSRRQSLDRPGILSPPGPFLTPSPSPSVSASPRLQPSPSLSPFSQDVLLVASGNTITNTTQDNERKAATPGRRQSIHQFTNGSPNAGTVVFQPSPSQSPAAATTVIGVTAGGLVTAGGAILHSTGNELNTTLVGSNNIQLNKKGNKRLTQHQQLQQQQSQQQHLQHQQQHQLSHQIFSTNGAAPNSISLAGGYGQSNATTAINTPTSFASANVASIPKSQAKKVANHIGISNSTPPATVLSQQQFQQQFQSSSPLIADSPIPSPSSTITAAAIKPPTPQPVQMLQQQFTITGHAPAQNQTAGSQQQQQPQQQVYQFIQGPQGQIIAAAQPHHQLAIQPQQQQPQRIANSTTITVPSTTGVNVVTKSTKQILPKPQQQHESQQQQTQQQHQTKTRINNNHNTNNSVTGTASNMPQMPQISQSPQPQQAQLSVTNTTPNTPQQQQIILPASATASLTAAPQPQPLLLNQMPVLVQQNTPQGVQLILRPPTPQLTATPSLVIQNSRGQPQLHQQQPQQQLLRIVGTNGATMQLTAATPTFIVSSQANLMQNQLQTAIKSSAQTNPITQLSGLHAALAAQTPRSQPFTTTATINTQLLGQSMAAQLQNLQLAAAAAANGNSITQIQMPNGLSTGAVISQLPAHLQQSLNGATINLNQLNGASLQQIATAFQTPQAAASGSANNQGSATDIYNQSSSGQVPVAVSSEPLRQATAVLHQQQQQQQPIMTASSAAATIHLQQQQQQQQQAQIQQLQQQLQQTQSQVHQAQQQQQMQQQQQPSEPKKKPRPRKKKAPTMAPTAPALTTTTTTTTQSQVLSTKVINTIAPSPSSTKNAAVALQQANISESSAPTTLSLPPPRAKTPSPAPHNQRASNGKLDLGNVMKLCGITEDDDDDEVYDIDTMSNTGGTNTVAPAIEDHTTNTPTTSTTTTLTNNSNDIMISIPNQNGSDGLPFTLTIPAPPPPTLATNEATETPNILIKIDQSDASQSATSTVPPYTISIPRLPTAEEIQKQAQQHLAQQAAAAAAAAAAVKNASASTAPTISFRLPPMQQQAQQPLTSQQQSIPSVAIAATPAVTTTAPALVSSVPISAPVSATTNTITSTAATTTATVKPRRKPAVRRNTKKQESIASPAPPTSTSAVNTTTTQITTTISTPIVTTTSLMMPSHVTNTTTVPSQIGNIQISQVQNHQTLPTTISNAVENKIQIMPIIDSSRLQNNMVGGITTTQLQHIQQHQTQNQQLVFQPPPTTNIQQSQESTTIKLSSDGRQMQLVAIPQANTSTSLPAAIQPVITATTNAQSLPPQITSSSITGGATILPPQLTGMPGNVSISVGSPASAAALIPQLTGSLTLAVSEHCERLILRHDPNQPQDQQSQLILQALLKGALPNLTIINEPTKVDANKQCPPQLQPQQVLNVSKTVVAPTTKIDKGAISKNITKAPTPSTVPVSSNVAATSTLPQVKQQQQQQLTKSYEPTQSLPQLPQISIPTSNTTSTTLQNTTTAPSTNPAAAGQQRYVALPKIDPSTQQLFCLNTINNQITAISPGQTAASISPTERLLIAPAGINAQQLAHCLQQGQIHFNDVNPLPSTAAMSQQQTNGGGALAAPNQSGIMSNQQTRLQPPQQQIVHPVQAMSALNSTVATTTTSTTTTTTTITKQVANVAPIIDQSKAKLEPSKAAATTAPKRKPVRKPKATTTAADVANMKNASVVKPMPKLDPLSQKPNNNPVQIVQPNVASGKQIVVSSSSNSQTTTTTTTTMSNSIQPFQQTSSGTKLVGITAPMQQQPPQQPPAISLVNNQQRSNFNSALAESLNNSNLPCNVLPSNNISVSSSSSSSSNSNNNSSFGHQITVSAPMNVSSSSSNQQQQQVLTTTVTTQPIQSPVVQPSAITSNGQQTQQQQQQQQSQQQQPQQPQQPQQHTVSRVQTIQLTPQQQQAFKQVQMQIHYLTIKLQHKIATLPISLPPDFDSTAIAAFNKPMTDAEVNIALQRLFMEQQRILASGKEIPTPEALLPTPNGNGGFTLMTQPQSGITEPPKTLASGSIPANVVQPNNHSMSVTAVNLQQQQPTAQQQQNVAQRIHIYPMQHHQNVQQNKQKQQQQQQQQNHQPTPKHNQLQQNQQQQQLLQGSSNSASCSQQPSSQQQIKIKAKEIPGKIKNISTPQQQTHEQQQQSPHPPALAQQQKPHVNSSVGNKALHTVSSQLSLPQLQQQQPQQQQQQLQHQIQKCRTQVQQPNCNTSNGPPPLLFPNSSHLVVGTGSASNANPSITSNNSTTLTQLQSQPQQAQLPISNSLAMTPAVVATTPPKPVLPTLSAYIGCAGLPSTVVAALSKTEEIPSPKPKIARLSLFVRQLEVDQESCLKPDYVKPFKTKEEAVKRLIRYHCMHENDEEIPSEEELEFEETAIKFQEQFRQLSGKFQHILLQESTLPHRTSESLQMQHLMIDDLKLEIDNLRNKEQEIREKEEYNKPLTLLTENECKPVKIEMELTNSNATADAVQSNETQEQQQSTSDIVKEEIKTEPYDQANSNLAAVDRFDLLKNSIDLNKATSKQQPLLESQQEHKRDPSIETTDSQKRGKNNWPNSNSNCHQKVGNNSNALNSISYLGNTASSKSHFNGAVKKDTGLNAADKEEKFVKKEYENFDIESELTPSFIMKKVEHREQVYQSTIQTNRPPTAKNFEACLDHYENTPTQQTHSKQQAIRINYNAKTQNTQQQPEVQNDDWYNFQKDLSLMNSVEQHQNSLVQQQHHYNNKHNNGTLQTQQQQLHQMKPMDIFNSSNSNAVINNDHPLVDLFPNGCIDKSQGHNSSSSSNSTINNSSCSQQRQQPVVLQQEASNQHPAISEFFSTNSDVQKSVETRLEAMFGESPVPLDVKSGNDSEDIESNLDEIFGDSKSSSESNKTKNNMWDQDITGNSFMRTGDNMSFDNEPHQTFSNNQQNHMQLNCNENQGWIENITHFSDFIGTNTTTNGEPQRLSNGEIRKRHWNGRIMASSSDLDDENSSKRRCTDSSSSSSPLSPPHVNHQHSLIDNDMLSLDDTMAVESTVTNNNANSSTAGFPQMMLQQQQQQHTFGNHQTFGNMLDAHSNVANMATTQQAHFQHNMHQQPQDIQQMHNVPSGGNAVSAGEFDDDISRHVQNAIDSILNLQNSESDSLTFSLGSFLGESILDDHRQQAATLPSCQQENNRRRQLVEELGDCLISGGATGTVTDNNTGGMMLETHNEHQQQLHHHHNPLIVNHSTHTHHQNTHHNLNQQHQQHEQQHQNNHQLQLHHHHQQSQPPQLNEFNCVTAGIDDAVKSIMTS